MLPAVRSGELSGVGASRRSMHEISRPKSVLAFQDPLPRFYPELENEPDVRQRRSSGSRTRRCRFLGSKPTGWSTHLAWIAGIACTHRIILQVGVLKSKIENTVRPWGNEYSSCRPERLLTSYTLGLLA